MAVIFNGRKYAGKRKKEKPIQTARIGFKNPYKEGINNMDDETEFDSHDDDELAECWFEFCKENGIITYVIKEIWNKKFIDGIWKWENTESREEKIK